MRKIGDITSIHSGVIEVQCDICGAATNGYIHWPKGGNGFSYSYSTVTIEMEDVTSVPGDTYGTKKYFDVCDQCFDKVVLPALEIAIGKKIHEQDFG